jgi:multidrug efflux pump subunit AcrA (membrane-fusion protein)
MFVTVGFDAGSPKPVTLVPQTAVQSVGDRAVVYVVVAEGDGRFVERTVKLGPAAGDSVQVLEGLKPGEKVVTEGSFFLRAEAARTRSGG